METIKKEIYELPFLGTIDRCNLMTKSCGVVFKGKIDDKRLNSEEEVLIATYPRTGTTWISQIISILIKGEEKFEESKGIRLVDRVPYLEMRPSADQEPRINILEEFLPPRADKTHLPYRLIKRWIEEDKVKTIITTRHPKDTLVSLFHFYSTVPGFKFNGTWEDYFTHYMEGKPLYGDQLDWYQDWSDNIKRNNNILVVRYEDMKRNLQDEIRRIVSFLEINASDLFIDKLLNISAFQNMKKDVATNFEDVEYKKIIKEGTFLRKGETSQWKDYFTVKQNELFDSVYKKRFKNLAINVEYD